MIIIMSSLISALFDDGREITLDSGRAVFRLGDPVRLMYFLVEGQIDLVRHTRSGSVLTLNRTGNPPED
jgi:CRP-like cAMP-binding protein